MTSSPSPIDPSSGLLRSPRWLLSALLAALLGWSATVWGLQFERMTLGVSVFWPLAGVALALALRGGWTLLPPAWLGAGLALSLAGLPPALAWWVAAGSMLAACIAALWLRRSGFHLRLEQSRDLWLLAGIGACGAAVLASAWAVASLSLAGRLDATDLPLAWLLRWCGDTLGLFIVGAPLLGLGRHSLNRAFAQGRWMVNAPLLAGAVASGVLALTLLSRDVPLGPLHFLPHVLLSWLALRAGLAVASSGVLVLLLAMAGPWLAPGLPHLVQPPWAYLASMLVLIGLLHALNGDLSRTQQRWHLALGHAGLGVAEWNLHGAQGYTSPRWCQLHGDPEGQRTGTLAGWLQDVAPEYRDSLDGDIDSLSKPTRSSFWRELRLATPDGPMWVELHLVVAERDHHGAPLRLLATVADVGERRHAQEQQRLSTSLFQNLHEGLLVVDAELRTIDANPTFCALVDTPRELLIGSVPALLRAPQADLATRQQQTAMWAGLRVTGSWNGEVSVRRTSGELVTLRTTVFTVPGPDGSARYHVVMVSDVTVQRQQRERLERQAHFDELTQLPNRARLSRLLSDAMAASGREGHMLAVVYIDLDHFKALNDVFGHATGDRALVELSQRLRGSLRERTHGADAVARLGGDEFVLLLKVGSSAEARLAVDRVLRVISQPFQPAPGAAPLVLQASAGATLYPQDLSDADTLLRHADQAMYSAKQGGRGSAVFFDPESSRRHEERVMAMGRVQEALDQHELVLFYQPKADLRAGRVLGFEALLRWNHPEQGLLGPASFLPLLENTGLSARVGDWVLAQALDQLDRWRNQGMEITVSVNVSARHLQEPDFAQRLGELLARHAPGLGEHLELEVLETAALADVTYTTALMERCRLYGVRFALDDFGTGYSTLTYLKRLPVQVLKIDRSFVQNMLEDVQDRAIVEGVLSLARTFGCSAVAEGVETPAQARALLDLGCNIGQGSGIAVPMPPAEAERFARQWPGLFALKPAVGG